MPTYVRPDLRNVDPAEVSDYLLALGIQCQTSGTTGQLVIETDIDATEALAAFVPTSTFDRRTGVSNYIPPIPPSAAVKTHLQHIKDFHRAVRDGTDTAITLDQTRHVVADIVDALRLLDSRLDRDL